MSSTTSRELVLVTGANGFIAARAIEAFLLAGYDVRGTVRSDKSGVAIQEVLKEYVDSGRFSVVIVPDITQAGAFDTAVKGCQAIAHLAAPVSLSFKDPVPVLHGAIVGTQTLLDSALSHGKDLKSVVLMSSIVAIINPNAPPAPGSVPHVLNEADWNTTSEEAVAKLGGNAASIDIYAASKTAAEKTFWKFRDEKNPGFTMSAVNPALVGGPPLIMPEKAEGINETVIHIWTILSGAEIPPTKGTMVDVRDVGRLLVFAVQHPEKADGQRYLASSAMGTNEAVSDILKEAYPDRKDIIKGGVGKVWEDKDFDISGGLDVSKAVNAMGRPFVGFKESVLDAAKSFERYL